MNTTYLFNAERFIFTTLAPALILPNTDSFGDNTSLEINCTEAATADEYTGAITAAGDLALAAAQTCGLSLVVRGVDVVYHAHS